MNLEMRLIDYLPAVYRQATGEGDSFLARFLEAFESALAPVHEEVDHISDLFSLTPTPTLTADVQAGEDELVLDSAAGLFAGDVLQVGADAETERLEFVVIDDIPTHRVLLQSVLTHRQASRRRNHDGSAELRVVPPSEGSLPGKTASTPYHLAANARAGDQELALNTTDGLYAGLSLRSGSPTADSTVAIQQVLPPDLLPRRVTLTAPLRHEYLVWTPVRVLGRPEASSRLAQVALPNSSALVLPDAVALGIDTGHLLGIGEGASREYVRVAVVEDALVSVTPPLLRGHPIGEIVTVLRLAETITPPSSFGRAGRDGPELMLLADAHAGERLLELDTLSGLQPGDILHIQDPNANQIEFVRIERPFDPSTEGTVSTEKTVEAEWRRGVLLKEPVRHKYPAGTPVGVLAHGPAAAPTRAAFGEEENQVVTVSESDLPEAKIGTVLRIVAGTQEAYTHVLRIEEDSAARTRRLFVATPTPRSISIGDCRVTPMQHEASGRSYLAWLAGWLGVPMRPDRGARWNRELLRRAVRIMPYRGTQAGVEAFLNSYLLGEATVSVRDHTWPMTLGHVAALGQDTFLGRIGDPVPSFTVDLRPDLRSNRPYPPEGQLAIVRATYEALQILKPAHATFVLRFLLPGFRLQVNKGTRVQARVGRTTTLGGKTYLIRESQLTAAG